MTKEGQRIRPARPRQFTLLLGACSALALSPAQAQETLPPPPAGSSERESRGDTAPQDSPAFEGLQEIVVTARRRPEPLQRTPISVVALSAEDLESRSITNLRSLQNFVPNLTLAASQNVGEAAGNAFIRGIGQEDFIAAAEPGVGFYLDGVYFARTTGTLMNLTDIARVEVLRGPQGTLFGKNTIGGAINIVSVAPEPERRRRFSLLLGNYDRAELRTVLNEPIAENVLLRFSAGLISRDGYLRRLSPPPLPALISQVDTRPEGDDRSQAERLQIRWLMGETFTADFSLDASRKRNTQGASRVDELDPRFGIFPVLNRLIRQGVLPGPEITNELPPGSFLQSYAAGSNFTDQDIWGASATLTKSMGPRSLKFIGAYRGIRNRVGTDPDGLYFTVLRSEFRENQSQYSAELQLGGSSRRLSYTAGLFGFQERVERLPFAGTVQNEVLYTCGCYNRALLPQPTANRSSLSSDSYAGYVQGTYNVTEALSTTLGVRYSHEIKTIDAEIVGRDAMLQPNDVLVGAGANKKARNSFTYRGGAEYQATPDVMTYASIAKGFKSGGFNARFSTSLPNLGLAPFAPETAVTYEIGLRSEWLDRKLRLNATLFHTDYANIQLRRQTISGGLFTTLIENAARARIKGAELELMAAPTKGLVLRAAYGHIDARYLDVGRVPGITPTSRFQRSPPHSFSASAEYEISLPSGTVELRSDYSYRAKEQFQITASPYDQEGYGLLAARATYRPRDAQWSAALFATNLTDERYRTAGRGTLINQTGIASSTIGMPRQVGVQATFSF